MGPEPMTIRPAAHSDRHALVPLRKALWPDGSGEEHLRDLDEMLTRGTSGPYPCAVFFAEDAASVIGFLEVGMRSHADGCDPEKPVGYIEGWFVAEPWRGRGVGRALVEAAENWARRLGCVEMASDTWIDNVDSQRAHEALGYEVVDRCVIYRKSL
jgi:aminoglycoside 6'-N-acetyltransferase I